MASPTFYSDGHTPRRTDTIHTILEKILGAVIDAGGGGASFDFGAADPVAAPTDPTVTALYYNTATKVLWVWNPTAAAWEA